jgi:hypothetical protein
MPKFDAVVVAQVVFRYSFEADSMTDAQTVAGDKARAELAAGAEWHLSDLEVHQDTPERPSLEELT